MLSQEEIQRYTKQILLPEVGFAGQKRLQEARVLVIGAGGLGCPALQYLTAAGVGHIGIVDFDDVELSNLQRQVLYHSEDVGKPKAEIAAERLRPLNPQVDFTTYRVKFQKSNAEEILSRYDLLIDCTDNFESRYLINDVCVLQHKPFVFGGIYKFEGQLAVFNHKGSATYRCAFPQTSKSNAADCNIAGVIGTLPGIIGSIQASEAIKIILDLPGVCSNKILFINTLRLSFNEIKISRNQAVWGDFQPEEPLQSNNNPQNL